MAGKTFFFLNYEALRHVETDAMVDTVPTAAEASGDFSQSGVNIYDPNTTTANPNYNPNLTLVGEDFTPAYLSRTRKTWLNQMP